MKSTRLLYLLGLIILLALAALAFVQLNKEFATPETTETHLGYPF